MDQKDRLNGDVKIVNVVSECKVAKRKKVNGEKLCSSIGRETSGEDVFYTLLYLLETFLGYEESVGFISIRIEYRIGRGD